MPNILEGFTALQDEVQTLLSAADIPQSYIDTILGIIACGERERQWQDDVAQLWQRYRRQSEDDATKVG